MRTLSRHSAEPARTELMTAVWRLGPGRLVWAILAATTVAAASTISNGFARAGTPQMPVTGYAQDGTAPGQVAASAAGLATLGVDGVGWTGSLLDLESLDAGDRAGLVTFVRTLGRRLPAGRTVSVTVAAFTSAKQYTDNGYDLRQPRSYHLHGLALWSLGLSDLLPRRHAAL